MNSVLINLVTFLVGLLVGNRMALYRDKRKEFDEAAQPIRAWLLREMAHPSPYRRRPDSVQIDHFESYLPFWKRKGFRRALQRQDSAREIAEERGPTGQVLYKDTMHIKECLNALLPFTKRC